MIVEDQVLIGLSLEAYLEDMGFGVGESLPSAAEALEWLRTNAPSFAIVDYTLKDGPCTALVRTLQERGVPFVIYSAHDRRVAPPELQDVAWINKPCDRKVLIAALTGAGEKALSP
jgi:DNA-binding response OmpR family regulator